MRNIEVGEENLYKISQHKKHVPHMLRAFNLVVSLL